MNTRLFLTMAMVATCLTAFAANPTVPGDYATTTVKVSAVAKTVILNIENLKNETVKIDIEDAEGVLIMSENVEGVAAVTKRYDVSRLSYGKYKIVVNRPNNTTIQPFEVEVNTVTVLDTEKQEKYAPVLKQNGESLDINFLTGSRGNVLVNIFDNEGRSFFEKTAYADLAFHQRFSLTKLPAGVYVVEVKSGNDAYYFTVSK